MRCSRCGSEMKIKNMKTGTDRNGNPVYHKYAVCYNCRIKRDLEKRNTSSSERQRKKRRKKKKRILLAILLLLLIAAAVFAGIFFFRKSQEKKAKEKQAIVTDNRKNLITPEAYVQIKSGMSLDEVKEIIGSDGSLLTRTTNETDTTERYQWITKGGEGTVLLNFSNEKLTSISQTGIDDSDASAISKNADSALRPEMTLQEVNDVMGISGVLISETVTDGVTTSTYGWGSDGNGYLYSIVFVDGKSQHMNTPQTKNNTTSSNSKETAESPSS